MKPTFKRFVYQLIRGNTVAQGILFLAAPILSRLYTPKEYGIYMLYLSIMSILGTTFAFSFERAIPLASHKLIARLLVKICCWFALICSFSMMLLYGVSGISIFSLLDVAVSPAVVFFLCIGAFFASVFQTFTYWQIRKEQFTPLSKVKFIQNTGTIGFQIFSSFGLIASDVLGKVGAVLYLSVPFFRDREQVKLTKKRWIFVVKKYASYLFLSSISVLINALTSQLPLWLITAYFSTEIAGFFGMGQRVIGTPVVLVTTAIGQVFYGMAAKKIKQNPNHVLQLYQKIVGRLAIYSLPVFLFLGLLAPVIFSALLGETWREAGEYVVYLCPFFYLQLITVPVSQTFYVLKQQRSQLIWDVGRFMSFVFIFGFAHFKEWDILTTLQLFSVVGSLFFLLYLVTSYRNLKKLTKKRVDECK